MGKAVTLGLAVQRVEAGVWGSCGYLAGGASLLLLLIWLNREACGILTLQLGI